MNVVSENEAREEYVTLVGAARILGMPPTAVRAEVKGGGLRASLVHGKYYLRVADLHQFMAAHAVGAQAAS